MNIRLATIEDLQAITVVESICFPAAEAASEIDLKKRLIVYPNHFWLLEDNGKKVIVDTKAQECKELMLLYVF